MTGCFLVTSIPLGFFFCSILGGWQVNIILSFQGLDENKLVSRVITKTSLDPPIKINGWNEEDRHGKNDTEGQECFKQKFFVESVAYKTKESCRHVEHDICRQTFRTVFRASQVDPSEQVYSIGYVLHSIVSIFR